MAKTTTAKKTDVEEIKTIPVDDTEPKKTEIETIKEEPKGTVKQETKTEENKASIPETTAEPLFVDPLTHKEKESLYRYIAGKQTFDVVRTVLAVKDKVPPSEITTERVNRIVEEYDGNVGRYLEASKTVPAGTGDFFNELQKGRTRKDALLAYARNIGFSDDEAETLLNTYTTGGITKVIEQVDNNYTTIVKVEVNTATRLMLEYFKSIGSILFSGKVVPEDPTTVKITPVNCVFKGCASAPETEHSSEYAFENKTSIEELNTEFNNIMVMPTSLSGVKLLVTIDTGEPREYAFNNVLEAQTDVDTTMDSSTPLRVGQYTKVNPIKFFGTVIKADPATVRIYSANCKFKGCVSSPETEHSGEYNFGPVTTLDALNTEFRGLEVQPYSLQNVSIQVSINSRNNRMFCWGDISPVQQAAE